MAVGRVSIDLEANTAKFERQMKSFSKKLDTQINKITSGLKKIGVAAGVAATGLSVLVKSSINANDELSKLSQKLGITTEDLSALAFAGDFAGASLNDLDKGLSAFVRRFNDFDEGVGLAKDAFESLGIKTRDADGNLKNLNQAFLETAEAVSRLPEGIEKTAIVQDIFSKNQAKLIPLLNLGAEGLEEYRKQAEQLGLIVDTRTAKASEKFNDQLNFLGKALAGVGKQIAAALLPDLIRMTEKVVGFATSPAVRGFVQTLVQIVRAIEIAVTGVIATFQALEGVVAVISKDMDSANDAGERFTKTVKEINRLLSQFDRQAEFTLEGNVTDTDKKTTGIGGDEDKSNIESFRKQIEKFYEDITDLNTQFATAFKNGFQGLEDAILQFTKNGKLNFKDLADSIINDLSRIAIKQAIIAPLVKGASSLIGNIFAPNTFGGLGPSDSVVQSGALPTISGARANGGSVRSGTSFLVGERGPEIFTPPTTGRIIPNGLMGDNMGSQQMNSAEVVININAIDTQTGTTFLLANKDTVEGIISNAMGTNSTIREQL